MPALDGNRPTAILGNPGIDKVVEFRYEFPVAFEAEAKEIESQIVTGDFKRTVYRDAIVFSKRTLPSDYSNVQVSVGRGSLSGTDLDTHSHVIVRESKE